MHLSDFISENMESIVQSWEDFADHRTSCAYHGSSSAKRSRICHAESDRQGSHCRANGLGAV